MLGEPQSWSGRTGTEKSLVPLLAAESTITGNSADSLVESSRTE